MSLTSQTIEIVKATAGIVAPAAGKITTRFYKNMFLSNPEVLSFFNKTNQTTGKQPEAFAHAVVAYAQNIENLSALGPAVELMAAKHCGLQVLPQHYPIVEENFMGAVGEVLGDAVMDVVHGPKLYRSAVLYQSDSMLNCPWKGDIWVNYFCI